MSDNMNELMIGANELFAEYAESQNAKVFIPLTQLSGNIIRGAWLRDYAIPARNVLWEFASWNKAIETLAEHLTETRIWKEKHRQDRIRELENEIAALKAVDHDSHS